MLEFVEGPALDTWIGEVEGLQSIELPEPLARYDCRNNRLAWLGLQQDEFLAKRPRHGTGANA